jgi:ABC-type glycerol-3-phosphate transport system permease component
MTTTSRMTRSLVFGGLCLLGIVCVYPLLFMALNSFRTNAEFNLNPFGLPTAVRFDNYRTLLDQFPFTSAMVHSVIVVIPAVLLATAFSALAAFVFTKTPFRGSNALFYLMLMVMLMPGVVLIIPLYITVVHIGLANSFVPAILIYTAINVPFGTYLLRANFRGIPDSLVEAARIDGASLFRVFYRIVVPVGMPGVIAVAILTFLTAWNELFISIVLLHTPATEMLTPTLTQLQGRYGTDIPVLMAGLLLGALPTVVIYLVFARYFVRGLMSGVHR